MSLLQKIILGVLASLILAAGVGLGLTWTPDRPLEELKAHWAPPPSQFISVMGMQVHLRDEGPRNDPQPIVLLHGTSASLHTWDGWAASLSSSHRVIRFDLPAFGLTGPDPDHNYTMSHYVDFVTQVLQKLGVDEYALAGNSLGGEIAWETAVTHPAQVRKLILVDAAGYIPSGSMPIGFKIAQIPALAFFTQHTLPRSMISASLKDVYGDPSKITPELINRYYELTLRAGNREAIGERFAQSSQGNDYDKIKQVVTPTLILWGDKDRLIPVSTAERFHNDIAGSKVVIFEGLGHVPQEESPNVSVTPVKQFLEMH